LNKEYKDGYYDGEGERRERKDRRLRRDRR